MSPTVHETFRNHPLDVVALGYCAAIWEGWKTGKRAALKNPNDPFIGGPMDLKRQSFNAMWIDGELAEIGQHTRIRLGQFVHLGQFEMLGWQQEQIEQRFGKDLRALAENPANARKDVVHPEYVATAEENFAVNPGALANNMVAGAAVLDYLVSFAWQDETLQNLTELVTGILAGENTAVTIRLNEIQRAAWVGRAVTDGSWTESGDFVYARYLSKSAAALDAYVVEPVLRMFLADLRAEKFGSLN